MMHQRVHHVGNGYSSPLLTTSTLFDTWPLREPTDSILSTTSVPLVTLPNTTCLPSSQAVLTVVMKNWDPFVSGPALAMLSMYFLVCLRSKFSSANFSP